MSSKPKLPPGQHGSSCTRTERSVLDMIKAWPGVPALVTIEKDGSWSVSTAENEIMARKNAHRQ